jgi:hypothetical protein
MTIGTFYGETEYSLKRQCDKAATMQYTRLQNRIPTSSCAGIATTVNEDSHGMFPGTTPRRAFLLYNGLHARSPYARLRAIGSFDPRRLC